MKMRISPNSFVGLYLWNSTDGPGTAPSLSFSSRISTLVLLMLTITAQSHTATKQAGTTDDDEPSATEMRLLNFDWWPTKGAWTRAEYSGSAACRKIKLHESSGCTYAASSPKWFRGRERMRYLSNASRSGCRKYTRPPLTVHCDISIEGQA